MKTDKICSCKSAHFSCSIHTTKKLFFFSIFKFIEASATTFVIEQTRQNGLIITGNEASDYRRIRSIIVVFILLTEVVR